ncbi:MAG TPA: vWA domain-containing protein [Chitinophagaceae bacterium]|nr:vWA domain-containing protein [Chitinophagaceae bacterium]
MKRISPFVIILVVLVASPLLSSYKVPSTAQKPKIQVAILLDVSNSMDGLIEQAKAQLWNMVTVLGKVKCHNYNEPPAVEIALYEYGRSSNDRLKGYVKQISPFTSDLDELSKQLFGLTTLGGDEYCGQVIHTSLDELAWDSTPGNYRVIFIAGNEDFLQGGVHYTKACAEAKRKGVIVNTIYCGPRDQGIREHWNLSSECGNGSFTNINSDARIEEPPTPFDSTLLVLNTRLNETYIPYGDRGSERHLQQSEVDNLNLKANPSAALGRVSVKGKASLYNNSAWDLVDAAKADSSILRKVDTKTLPKDLQKMSSTQLAEFVKSKAAERARVQQEIELVSNSRQSWLVEAKKNRVEPTLETEIEKVLREQAKRFRMIIE